MSRKYGASSDQYWCSERAPNQTNAVGFFPQSISATTRRLSLSPLTIDSCRPQRPAGGALRASVSWRNRFGGEARERGSSRKRRSHQGLRALVIGSNQTPL